MNQVKIVFMRLRRFVPFSHLEHLADVYQANRGGNGVLGLEPFHLPGLRADSTTIRATRSSGRSERPANQARSHRAGQHARPLDVGRYRRSQRLFVARSTRAAFDGNHPLG
jgi:hypothetical protein